MGPLTIALLGVGGLVLLNLGTAVFVRVLLTYRRLRESSARTRMRMREGVAAFAVEITDELPRALTTFERRLLRETLLETAHELSGSAFDRLAASFAERGFIAEAERSLRSRLLLHRVRGAEIIGELGGLDSVPALRKGLRDREPLVRFACAHALTRVGAEGLLDEVLAALAEGETVFSQGALAEVLLDSGPDSVTELRTLLGDPRHPQRRRLIVVVLGELRAFDAVPELIAALRDPDDELCARACHALGKIGDPESAEPLAAVAMDGGAPLVRAHRRGRRLRADRRPAHAPTLVDALDSEEWYPRNAAAAALVRLEDAGVAAVCSRVASLEPESVAHYWGLLDAAGRTEATIVRAAAGERRVRRFVTAAARAGATARLEDNSSTRSTRTTQHHASAHLLLTPACAICNRISSLKPKSVAHYWAVLDAAGRPRQIAAPPRRAPVRRSSPPRARRATARSRSSPARDGDGPLRGGVLAPTGRYRRRRTAPSGGGVTRTLPVGQPRRARLLRLILVSYSLVTLLSWVQVRRYYRRLVHARLQRSVRSQLTPPISICAPAYNESEVIVDAMRSMLGLRYPEHEVVLTNDGSTDDTLDQLIEAFSMYRVDQPEHPRIRDRARARRVALAHPLQPRRRRQGERRARRRAERRRSTSRATRWSAASTPTRCSSPRRW